jgi:peptide/nickel transport system permease protein
MLWFATNRLLGALATLVFASFLVFVLLELTPGNVAAKQLGPWASQASKDILFKQLKLDDPLPVRYGRWLGVLLGGVDEPFASTGLGFPDPRGSRYVGNFGYSQLYKMPVNDILWERLANTAILAAVAVLAIVPLALVIGIVAAMFEHSPIDRCLSTACVALAGIPEYASAVILMAVFVVWLGWLPGTSNLETGRGWSLASQLALPAAVLVLYDVGYVARIVRSSMAAVLRTPYIRTAILKGLPMRTVVTVHALRNAMIAPFTVLLLQISWLLSGVVVTEVVFSYPGFGRMLYEAAMFGDIALLEAATLTALVIASATQFASDIAYRFLNPRIQVS